MAWSLGILQGNKKLWNRLFQLPKNCSTMYVTKQDHANSLKITRGRRSSTYYYIWLRDHCRCDECYNSVTFQRKLSLNDIPDQIKPKTVHLHNDGLLRVIWEGGHKSEYLVTSLEKWLFENHVKRLERQYKLWSANDVAKAPLAHITFGEELESELGIAKLLKSLVEYGVAFIENVPPDVKHTENAVEKIGIIQNTLFGKMWEFSDSMDHKDTAYTNECLDPHTDNTYFTEAAGLQVLHCIFHDGDGGENVLVDGFQAANLLKEHNPVAFKRLSTTNFRTEYIEDGHHHENSAPVIKLNPLTHQIEQIRFNMNDRAPVILPEDQILHYYDDLRALSDVVKNEDLHWVLKLKPGTVLIFDNFRILHGRKAYTGRRVMCGCYIGRSDFLSKARVFQLIDQ